VYWLKVNAYVKDFAESDGLCRILEESFEGLAAEKAEVSTYAFQTNDVVSV
jgi:hypothetical protein